MTTPASLPERPLLAPWYRLAEEPGRLVFEHAGRAVVLEGAAVARLLPALLPLLDGTRTTDEVVRTLGPAVAPAVEHALRVLAGRGLLTDGPAPEAGRRPETAEHLAADEGAPPALAAAGLAEARVAVGGASPTATRLRRLLRRAAVGSVVARGEPWVEPDDTLVVVAPAAGARDELAAWNELTLRAGTPWLPVVPDAAGAVEIGPLVLPGRTACAACRGLVSQVPGSASATLAAAAAAVAAEHALRWLALADPRLPGVAHVLEWAGGGLRLSARPVARAPRCAVCSDAQVRANAVPWHEAA